jgi:hypothetical protein
MVVLPRPGEPAFITASYGVFTSSSAANAVGKEHSRKLMFTTNKDLHFSWKSSTDTERGENCLTVYENMRRNHQFKPRTAPIHHKDSCTHRKHFEHKVSVDFDANRRMLEMSKNPVKSSDMPDLQGKSTMYLDSFRKLPDDEFMRARQPRLDPETSGALSMGAPMIVKKASTHDTFREWPVRKLDETRPRSAIHTRPQDTDQGQLGELGSATIYNLQTGPKQRRDAPRLSRAKTLPKGASVSLGGGSTVRLKCMAGRQNDWLHATRSFAPQGTI